MALVLKDRVKQTTTTTGTGSIVLNGNIDSFQTFAAALTDGDTTYYGIFEPSTNEYEVGLGTWTESSATLARTTVLESSNSGSAVSLTAQAEVFITQPAEKSVFQDANGDVDLGGNKLLFGNVYSSTGDLPSASTYHGMFAHVHGTGKGYFAHAGNWVELANQADVTAAVNALVDSAPGTLDTLNELAAALGDDANFSTTVTNSIATKLPLSGGAMTGAITTNSTFDGRDVATDGAKLDGIESGATADQTKADIDALGIAASTASTLATARNIAVTGAVTGNADFDGSGNISISTTATADPTVTLTGAVTGSGTMTNLGNVSIATTATADPTLTLSGDASGSATFTNLGNATLSVTVADDSHNHVISNVDGLQTALDGKLSTSGKAADSNLLDGLDLHSGRNNQANSVVRTQSNGYVDFGWINTTSGDTTGSLSRAYVDTGDGYIRKCTMAHLRSQMGALSTSGKAADSNLLDGIDSSAFLRSNANDTMTGTLAVDNEFQVINGNGTVTHFNNSNSNTNYIRGTNTTFDTPIDMNNNNITDVEDIGLQDRIYHDGDSDTYMQFHAANQWRVVTGGSERLEVNNSQVTITNGLTVSNGDITLSGTGRIQGVDTVSSGTDAANKNYVDTAVASAGGGTAFSAF